MAFWRVKDLAVIPVNWKPSNSIEKKKKKIKYILRCCVKLPTGQFPASWFSEVFIKFLTSSGCSTPTEAEGCSWKAMTNENCHILHWVTPLGSSSAADTKCVFISVYLCQLGTQRQCERPALVFDKQGRQGCGRQIRVPGKELPVTGNTHKNTHTKTHNWTQLNCSLRQLLILYFQYSYNSAELFSLF